MARALIYHLLGVVLATFLVWGQVEASSHDVLDQDPVHQTDCAVCHFLSDDDEPDVLYYVKTELYFITRDIVLLVFDEYTPTDTNIKAIIYTWVSFI